METNQLVSLTMIAFSIAGIGFAAILWYICCRLDQTYRLLVEVLNEIAKSSAKPEGSARSSGGHIKLAPGAGGARR